MKKMLGLSSLLFITVLMMLQTGVSSCTKDRTIYQTVTRVDTVIIKDKPVTTPLGLWEGTFSTDQVSHAPGYVAFVLYSDSTISRRTQNPVADIFHKGRWTIANNRITFTDTTINFSSPTIQNGSFVYNAVNNTLTDGNWRQTVGNLTGTFSTMQKIK